MVHSLSQLLLAAALALAPALSRGVDSCASTLAEVPCLEDRTHELDDPAVQAQLYRFLGEFELLHESCGDRFDPYCLGRSVAGLTQPLPRHWPELLVARLAERRRGLRSKGAEFMPLFTGTVTLDGAPVAGATVSAFIAGFRFGAVATATTDAQGRYELAVGINGAQSFYLVADTPASPPYAWRGTGAVPFPANGNPSLVGDPVGASIPVLDFDLTSGASIGGHLTDRNGFPVTNEPMVLRSDVPGSVFPEDFQATDASGVFRFDGLLPGRYRVARGASERCIPDAIDRCNNAYRLVEVAAGEVVDNAHLIIGESGAIRGTVRALDGDAPLAGATVTAYDTRGRFAGSSGFTSEDGRYEIPGLVPGAYRLLAASNFAGQNFVPILWPDRASSVASTTDEVLAAPVVIAPPDGAIEDVDFALPPAGRITGMLPIVDPPPGEGTEREPIWQVDAYGEAGELVASFSSFFTLDDHYELERLRSGNYNVVVADVTTEFSNVGGIGELPPIRFARQLIPNGPCTACDTAALGTPIPVTEGLTTTGIDLVVSTGTLLTGRIVVARTGGPARAEVRIVEADSPRLPQGYRFLTDIDGFFQAPVGAGPSYALLASDRSSALNHVELFGQAECPRPELELCPVDAAVAITVGGAPVTDLDFVFDACAPDAVALDLDGDGRRDQCDVCYGDDAAGDRDGDGICGDLDCGDDNPDEGWCRRFDGGRVSHLAFDGAGGGADRGGAVTELVDELGFHAAVPVGETLIVPGVLGGALDFDGAGAVDLPTAPLQAFPQCTVAAWVRLDGVVPGSPGDACCNSIFSEDAFTVGALHINQNFDDESTSIEFALAGAGTVRTGPVSPGVWTHIAYRYDASTRVANVFVDGQGVVTDVFSPRAFCGSGRPATFGAWDPNANGELRRFLDGAIDDFRIYARVLSPAEIMALASRRELMFAGAFEALDRWSGAGADGPRE